MIKIYDKNITIHEVTLKKIIDQNGFTIEFDDINEKRRKICFPSYRGIKLKNYMEI